MANAGTAAAWPLKYDPRAVMFRPPGSVDVTFSRLLPRYAVRTLGGMVVAGSSEGLAYALFRINKLHRPRRRGLRNPTRSTARTDFGRHLP